jgi:NAD+ kinase
VKKIGLFVKLDAEAIKKADELEKWLRSRGIMVVRKKTMLPGRLRSRRMKSFAPSDLFCIFALGGDGTFLSAVHWIGDRNIPIHGIKFGEVGFLAETSADNLFAAAETIMNNEFLIKPRMRLLVKVYREGEEMASEMVLNDAVINKGALARLANIDTYINDHFLTTYRADGLIVSTPTGSTAYSLAAGGPILHPGVPGIIMTPICPHTLTNRPLIVPDSVSIRIKLAEKSSDVMLTFDGQAGLDIDERDTIIIQKGPHPIQMIVMPDRHYYDLLKTKLRWSGSRV